MNGENNIQVVPPVEAPETKKKSKVGLIIGLIIILCLIGVGVFFLLTKTDLLNKDSDKKDTKTEEKKEEPKEEENKPTEEPDSKYSGVYKRDDMVLKIFCFKNNDCSVIFKDDVVTSSYTITINKDIVEEDSTSLKFENDTVTVKETNTEEYGYFGTDGVYKRVSDYKAIDYYKDNYGDPELLKSNISGYYELNDKKMYVIPITNDKAKVNITGDFGYFDVEFDVKNDTTLHVDFLGDEYTITFEDQKATFTTGEIFSNEASKKEKDGTYQKIKDITYMDIIENVAL